AVGTRQSFAIPFCPISSIGQGNIAVADRKPASMSNNNLPCLHGALISLSHIWLGAVASNC
ncbi:MAG: hypothetical protein K8I29_03985, partial [Alphaproteobacteria bacterium]|nr:hypothetical protein [Candidatus Nitrobium versatile]